MLYSFLYIHKIAGYTEAQRQTLLGPPASRKSTSVIQPAKNEGDCPLLHYLVVKGFKGHGGATVYCSAILQGDRAIAWFTRRVNFPTYTYMHCITYRTYPAYLYFSWVWPCISEYGNVNSCLMS